MKYLKKLIRKIINALLSPSQKEALLKIKPIKTLNNIIYNDTYYYCKVLNGSATYNLCINSDLTVSCNCQDYDGRGVLGDLHQNNLDQILRGKIAKRFRAKLAKGLLPTPVCHICQELIQTDKKDARRHKKNYSTKQENIMVENVSLCNLKCISCDRQKVMSTRRKTRMTLEDMEKVAKTVNDNNINTVYFYNLGEPFISDTIFEEINILRKYNPELIVWISTNGILINSERKIDAALLSDHIFFSIDGPSQKIVEKYQVGADFSKMYKSMKELVLIRDSRKTSKPSIEWKYVVFAWNDKKEHIEIAIELARKANVDSIFFTLGGGLPHQVSERYLNDPYFQNLGKASWKGREVQLR